MTNFTNFTNLMELVDEWDKWIKTLPTDECYGAEGAHCFIRHWARPFVLDFLEWAETKEEKKNTRYHRQGTL